MYIFDCVSSRYQRHGTLNEQSQLLMHLQCDFHRCIYMLRNGSSHYSKMSTLCIGYSHVKRLKSYLDVYNSSTTAYNIAGLCSVNYFGIGGDQFRVITI